LESVVVCWAVANIEKKAHAIKKISFIVFELGCEVKGKTLRKASVKGFHPVKSFITQVCDL
jgi:hypothetical protein